MASCRQQSSAGSTATTSPSATTRRRSNPGFRACAHHQAERPDLPRSALSRRRLPRDRRCPSRGRVASTLLSTRLGKVRPKTTEHDTVPTPTAYEIETAEEPFALQPYLLQDTYRGRVVRVARCRQSLEPQPL